MFFGFFLFYLVFCGFWCFGYIGGVSGLGALFNGVFCLDAVSLCLSLLSLILLISLFFWSSFLSYFSWFMILLSVFSAIMCYNCVHALWFWVFYEMSLVPLLVLLSVDSPYSERYLALWYFLGYGVLSSLPMLVAIFYLSWENGGFCFRSWESAGSTVSFLVCCLLAVMFIVKIPLFPFHVWLPIVHAEASSPVSVCLSGYIMKLGLLGIYRFCWGSFSSFSFSVSYLYVCFGASILFFFCALRELDGKRWLAFFSLGHIVIAAACLGIGGFGYSGVCFVYCLGHGLSAAAMFLFLWGLSCLSGSRNWLLLKNSIWGSFVIRSIFCFALATVCCIPPTPQFFGELGIMIESVGYGGVVPFLVCVYLYLGGLIPVIVLGSSVSRHYDVSYSGQSLFVCMVSVSFLLFWCFSMFMFF